MPRPANLLVNRRTNPGIALAFSLIKSKKQEAQLILLIQNHSKPDYVSAEILRAAGYEVVEAEDGIEGSDLLNKHHFDLTITDVLMPNLGGIAIVARIRVAWPEMPIILTGKLRQSGVETILKQPIEIVQKPIGVTELLATVQRMLARRSITTAARFVAEGAMMAAH
jgi:CheY-like chemotaxis protein